MGVQPVDGRGPQTILRVGSRVALRKVQQGAHLT